MPPAIAGLMSEREAACLFRAAEGFARAEVAVLGGQVAVGTLWDSAAFLTQKYMSKEEGGLCGSVQKSADQHYWKK